MTPPPQVTVTPANLAGDLSDAKVSQVPVQDTDVQRVDDLVSGAGLQRALPVRRHKQLHAVLLLLPGHRRAD